VWIWESRGSPNGDIPAVDADLELATQARDFAAIVERLGIADFHFVGWCQAAQLAVYTAATRAVRPRSMSFIAPAGFGYSLLKSEFERCALPVYLEIARQGVAAAEKLGRILDKYRDAPPTPTLAGDRLTLLHLADPEATYVFSKYMRAYEENKAVVTDLASGVLDRIPTQTIHCKDDTYSHFSESVQLTKRHPSVQLSLLPRGGHLQVFDEAEAYGDLVVRLIRQEEERVAGGTRARAVS
jgi:pimeloyl-ACP methyl ester carboxylesterase